MIDAELLAPFPGFEDAPPSALRAIASRATERRFATGETLFNAGTTSRGLFIVLEGSVRVVRAGGDRRHVVHSERAGGTLGEVSLFDGGGYPATAIAAEPTICIVIARDALLQSMSESPEVALVFLRRLASRVRALVERLDERSARTVTARLAEYLLDRPVSPRSASISLGMTQAALAEELGTVREVVVRSLRAFTARGLIAPAGRWRWPVPDRDGLMEMGGRK